MAMNDLGKLFETSSASRVQSIALGAAVKANTLIAVFMGGEAGSTLSVSNVTDSKGNVYQTVQSHSATLAAIAWTRTKVAMTTSDTITVTLNRTPTVFWKSAHNFENADSTPLDTQTLVGTSTAAYVTVDVSGSDWLALGVSYWSRDALPTTTELDSCVSQDNVNGGSYSAECWSYNGTTGTTTRIGATTVSSLFHRTVGISLPFQSSSTGRQVSGIFMGI
jgi:hypothetical protein